MATNEEKTSKNVRLDKYTQKKLAVIMAADLFTNENDAIRAAIVELANRIEAGEFTPEGRKI